MEVRANVADVNRQERDRLQLLEKQLTVLQTLVEFDVNPPKGGDRATELKNREEAAKAAEADSDARGPALTLLKLKDWNQAVPKWDSLDKDQRSAERKKMNRQAKGMEPLGQGTLRGALEYYGLWPPGNYDESKDTLVAVEEMTIDSRSGEKGEVSSTVTFYIATMREGRRCIRACSSPIQQHFCVSYHLCSQ